MASNLYFVVQDLSLIEPVYQFSLDFFINVFERSIENATGSRNERVRNINSKFCYNLYLIINQSLLSKDKL